MYVVPLVWLGTLPSVRRDDHVLGYTRVLAAVIIPFLVAAFVLLYVFPADTARLFAWTITSRLTAMVLAWSGPRCRAGFVAVLVLAATVSTAANKSYRDQLAGREPALLANRIAGEMADFDRTAAGDARRCALRAEFRTLYADSAFSLKRFDQSLDVAAEQQAGRRFCEAAR